MSSAVNLTHFDVEPWAGIRGIAVEFEDFVRLIELVDPASVLGEHAAQFLAANLQVIVFAIGRRLDVKLLEDEFQATDRSSGLPDRVTVT